MLDLNMEHLASVTKTRIKFLDGKAFVPTPEIGQALLEWLNTGAPADVSVFTPGVDPKIQMKLDEIKDILGKRSDGDEQRAQNLLTLLTEHKVNGETEWVKLEELDILAATKPQWIDVILNKLTKEEVSHAS
jgi:hypothetical protein